MHDWLKQNQKKVMAILGAMLMVTFLITPGALNGRSQSRGMPIGTIGKTVLYADDLRQAETEWSILRACVALAPMQRGQSLAETLGKRVYDEMDDHRELYLLLIKEAEQHGIAIPKDDVGSFAKNDMFARSRVSGDLLQTTVQHYLMVRALLDQLSSTAKLSEPSWLHVLAEEANLVSLNLVEFTANENRLLATAPTTQQVNEQFEKYANVLPDSATPDNPLAFGYKVPNRVKVQYVSVTPQQAMDAVRASKDAYDLDVQARMYYLNNQGKFPQAPATQPTTLPATNPTSQPLATTAPTTAPATQSAVAAPTTRPFADVKDEILQTLLKPQAEELQKKVVAALHDRLASDYAYYRAAHPLTTQPTTAPATLPADVAALLPSTQPSPYDSYAYLQAVALDMQRQFKLLPSVHQIGQWEDARQLAQEPGIGSATAGGEAFPQYVTERAAPFLTDPAAQAAAMQALQPSEPFTGADQAQYIARLTDVSPAHAPALADVRPRVQADVQLKLGWDAANAAATKIVDAARKTTLARAALDDNRQSFVTGSFEPFLLKTRGGTIPNFSASPQSVAELADKAADLLSQATTADPHPLAIIPMPADKMVIVAQLSEITMSDPPDNAFRRKLMIMHQLETLRTASLAARYFAYDAVAARLNFVPAKKSAEE